MVRKPGRPAKPPSEKWRPHAIKVPPHLESKARELARQKRLSGVCSEAIEQATL